MEFEGKNYTAEGWFSGLPGDETKYTLLFDSEANCYISPMELEEAEYLWQERQEELQAAVRKSGKIMIFTGLAMGTYLAYKTGALGKATRWVKGKFSKKENETVVIDSEL